MPQRSGKRITDSDRDVGRRIKFARISARLTQAELATRLGVSFQQVQKYENGRNRVSVGRLTEIAAACGQPAAHFMPGSEAFVAIDNRRSAALVEVFNRIADDDVQQAIMKLMTTLAEAT